MEETVGRVRPQLEYCYQTEANDHPGLSGKILFKFVIAADGTVSSAKVTETTMNHGTVEACICSRFERLQFPEPRGGGIVIVSYPLEFK